MFTLSFLIYFFFLKKTPLKYHTLSFQSKKSNDPLFILSHLFWKLSEKYLILLYCENRWFFFVGLYVRVYVVLLEFIAFFLKKMKEKDARNQWERCGKRGGEEMLKKCERNEKEVVKRVTE
ncbi:hypothetical protein RFI_32706 [Reticulomyxa filosa]|uniref:Uncharacterized protein n=1 Tax=Reticulomyxa filosa TaxID=46433 RepID=X6LSQ9_RETFI|nr:hypothetical protein RFI_32706 [Reticulomyxa filosa]|eukprot:ETO04689.1 hypothetical protein RFI_32706 [Reticulomyxa filosa]